MRRSKPRKWFVSGIVMTLLVSGLSFFLAATPQQSFRELPAGFSGDLETLGSQEKVPEITKPHVLLIPSLRIEAPISPTLIATSRIGVIEPPTDGREVAYWSGGVAQHETGTQVLVGHVQTKELARGALWSLADATFGALVATTDSSGEATWWQIRELFSVPKQEFPFYRISQDGDSQLWIVTCGAIDNTHNIVAIASPL